MCSETVDPTLVSWLREARRILVFTGAGISTNTGIPDFRGPGGVWSRRQPVYYDQFMTSHAARVEHWDFKLEAWPLFRRARPTASHDAIVRLEKAGKLHCLVTQNIDGLHGLAGTSRERLVEIHGSNAEVECQSCLERFAPDAFFKQFERTREPPVCPSCGGFLKPATISFGQSLRSGDVDQAFEATKHADLVVALGSTLSVYPAAEVPLAASRAGARYVVLNRGPTDHDALADLRLEGDVDELFPTAVDAALRD